MSLTCVIVDDEYLAINVLKEYASGIEGLEVKQTFTDPVRALSYLRETPPELILLDIRMPLLSGFELLSGLEQAPTVIFTTAHQDYAVRAFELDVLDYLVKPVSLERFTKAILRAKEYIQYKKDLSEPGPIHRNYVMVRSDHRVIKILFDDIDYIEGLGEYVRIYTHTRIHVTLAALKRLEKELPPELFTRIHKSYIVSRASVASFNTQEVMLKSAKRLPVGRVYKENIKALL